MTDRPGDPLDRIISAEIGLIPSIAIISSGSPFGDGSLLAAAQTGWLDELHPDLDLRLPDAFPSATGGACAGAMPLARMKAVMEALERYATTVFARDEYITARADALGPDGLMWTGLPGVHVRAAEDAPWAQSRLQPTAQIRWISGYHMLDHRQVPVPLAMAHIHFRPMPGESFHPPSTAGVAAHFSLGAALLSGIYELVEREAVEAVWALRAPLPRIVLEGPLSPELRTLVEADALPFIDQHYYDATTDLGIPTIYAVRRLSRPIGSDVIVTCACDHDAETAVLKARREAAGLQLTRQHKSGNVPYSRDPTCAGRLLPDWQPHLPDLSFLDDTGLEPRRLSAIRIPVEADTSSRTSDLLDRLAPAHPTIIAVNLTTRDLELAGVHVVRAIVPTLLPMSPSGHHGYLDHPRLARLARHYGLPASGQRPRNPAPQPFR